MDCWIFRKLGWAVGGEEWGRTEMLEEKCSSTVVRTAG